MLTARNARIAGGVEVSWSVVEATRRYPDAACAFCGQAAPEDATAMHAAGWQVRSDYPIRYRCPECRRQHEREAA